MKIIFLTPNYLPHLGGVERHVQGLSAELIKKGHQVTLITKKNQPGDIDLEDLDGVSVHRIDLSDGEKRTLWPWIWRNRALFLSADVIHSHDIFFWYLPYRVIFFGKKVYHTFHGWEGVFPPTWKSKGVRKITEQMTDGQICIGKFICRWYGSVCPVITHGAVEIDPRPQATPSADAVFVGRLAKDTGFREYLEAWGKFTNGETLKIAGDGPLRTWGEEFVKSRGLKVEFLGFVEDVIAVIDSGRVVLTSGYLSILQAMSRRRIVIGVATNPLKEDYLREILSGGLGYLVTAEDLPDQLSQALNTNNMSMVERAYEFAAKQTWDKLADDYLKLWGVS